MFDSAPKTWKQLQSMVAQAFREMDCEAEIEKNIVTARGTANIDVFVTDRNHTPPLVQLCECKYWLTSISKAMVHSFRTVVQDFGAHIGLIISRSGFQSGCYKAAKNSNIFLLSWQEFLDMYEAKWTIHICKRLDQMANVLNTYCTRPELAERYPSRQSQTDEFIMSWKECIKT